MELTPEQKKFWDDLEFFKPEEFDSPDESGSGLKMDTELLRALHYLRIACSFPLHINSGYRTESYNTKIGGEENSSHLRGFAADIQVLGSRDRFTVVSEAINLGFHRIGIGNGFVHVDMDKTLPSNVLWLYTK